MGGHLSLSAREQVAPRPKREHEGESKAAVLAAMVANFAIAIGKLVAGIITGSAALLAEAGHSVADTVNQVFLLIGINLSDTVPDESHPHGYGKEAFFWSFLAAIFIFVAGAVLSFFEGIRTAIQNDEHERAASELILAFSVLGMAIVFEAISFAVAMRSLLRGAKRKGWGILRYIREAPDVTTKTVFFEDSAAITGLVLAASGLALSEITGNEMWDAVASISIGVVLAAVSVMLGVQSRKLLLGAAASEETRIDLHKVLMTFPEVQGVMRMLTMQLGSNSVLVTGELRVQRNLTTEQIEDLLRRIDGKIAADVPEVAETFWELSRQANGGLLRPSAGPRESG